jgi:Skp family chaperone for outer membrane proteins
MMQPLFDKVDEAVMKICVDKGYDYVLNTDNNVYIAINPRNGKDITAKVKAELNIADE